MNYMDIREADIANGEHVRVSIWVSGCTRHCPECFNPQAWSFNAGRPFTPATLGRILNLLANDYIDGLSILGGEPLESENVGTVTEMCRIVKEFLPSKTIWLYTGNKYEDVKDLEVFKYIDVVVDGDFQIDKKDPRLAFRGSSNQNIIRLKEVKI